MQSGNFWMVNNPVFQAASLVLVAVFLGACGQPDNPSVNEHEPGKAEGPVPAPARLVTVSGMSSGGYMAVQTHVALADRVAGAGVVAAGPYHCAAGAIGNALGRCMSGDDLEVIPLVAFTREAAAGGQIAAVEYLRNAKVWIFHGSKDEVVASGVTDALADFYLEFVAADRVVLIDDIDAAHGWPTLDQGGACLEMSDDFINACDFDAAGSLMNHLYDNLNPRATALPKEDLAGIDLSGYFESGSGVADAGFIYVPERCRDLDADCRLHISFHGCRQGAEFVGDRFAVESGLNEWAVENQIVVIYPQIESSLMNPLGCWDWWGYTGTHYDQKDGRQISGIDAVITAFSNRRLYRD